MGLQRADFCVQIQLCKCKVETKQKNIAKNKESKQENQN